MVRLVFVFIVKHDVMVSNYFGLPLSPCLAYFSDFYFALVLHGHMKIARAL